MMESSTCGYLIRCHCGDELRVRTEQAGATVRCPRCDAEIAVPQLSRLRQLPLVAGLADESNRFQFSLRALFVLVLLAAVSVIVGKAIGFHWLLVIPICTSIGVLGAAAPRPVLYGGVLGGIFLLIGTLIVCSVAQTRERSRNIQVTNNLREMSIGQAQARRYQTGP
jgi:hypothetical protein